MTLVERIQANIAKGGLHPITGSRKRCGPSALSAVTGITADEAARAIRSYWGVTAVYGTPPHIMERTLEGLGVDATTHYLPHNNRPTLAEWLRRFGGRSDRAAYIVWSREHYIAVGRCMVSDSGAWFSREPKRLSQSPGKRRVRVQGYIRIEPPKDKALRQIKKLVSNHDLTLADLKGVL